MNNPTKSVKKPHAKTLRRHAPIKKINQKISSFASFAALRAKIIKQCVSPKTKDKTMNA